jgi:predicted extracellular nuclease
MPALKSRPNHARRILALVLLLCTAVVGGFVFSSPRVTKADTATAVSIAAVNTPVTQDFNTLVNTGTGTLAANTPAGWGFLETGTNANTNYTAGTGSSNAGDTYSFGTGTNADRALGGLQSGSLVPIIGARFVNNTGTTITSLGIAYTGEQWRLGTSGRAIPDRLDFQFGATATGLNTGTYVDVDALDFVQPLITGTVGALDGNAAANRTAISSTITGLSIAPGAEFWIRWNSFDATGADDGLGIDDFSITANPGGGPVTPSLSINDVTQAEGDSGTTTFTFTVSLSSPANAGGVTFDIATADGTATVANNDYVANSLTGQTIAQGNTSATFNVTVNGDTTPEPNETFFVNVTNVTGATVTDGQGQGTITNDDVTITNINQIQGSGALSPLAGQSVSTRGIVTAITSSGFFMQSQASDVDADPNTSEGMFVFTSTAPPASAAIGNLVQVTGTVTEFLSAGNPTGLSLTEITSPTVVQLSTGNPLPAPVVIDSTIGSTPSSLEPALPLRYERFEFMRVTATLTVIAANDGNVTESSATSGTFDDFYAVPQGVSRPFREAGLENPFPAPAGSSVPPIPRWDANPERLRVRSSIRTSGATGQPVVTVAAGDTVGVTGVLDYFGSTRRIFTIIPDAAPSATANRTAFTPVPTPNSGELTIASANVERFFDDVNDPAIGEPVLTTTAFNNRLNKASLMVRNVMMTPDVIGFQEVENLSTLQALATKINNDAVAASQPNPGYQAFLVEGNDVGGIDVGFLVKNTVSVSSVTQFGLTDTYINPVDGTPDTLNDRPPLVLVASKNGYAFTVIVNHLRSLNGIDDETVNGSSTNGGRVRAKRRAQAEYLATLIQNRLTSNPNERIIALGDFNAFQFNDGYVDSIGTIKGTPTAAGGAVLTSPDLLNPDLINLVESETANERYSFVFDGSAQTLDHVLVTPNLQADFVRINHARNNADFPEGPTYRNDPNRPERLSDHDPVVVAFNTLTPVNVNANVSLTVTSTTVEGPTCGAQGYSNDIVLNATLTNRGTTAILSPLYFEVTELREANGTAPAVPFRLISADGATCSSGGTVGAQQTISLSGQPVPGTLAPGASVSFQFRIAAPSVRRIRFFGNVFGINNNITLNRSKQTESGNSALAFEFDPTAKPVFVPARERGNAMRAK